MTSETQITQMIDAWEDETGERLDEVSRPALARHIHYLMHEMFDDLCCEVTP
jgi:hypothetical protein